jgi:molybdate transport system ATP-binding protein
LAETSATTQAQAAQSTLAPAQLSVRMRHRIGALEVDVDFRLDKPWTILFGPSGSGKTTILRAIAGLLRPDEGSIVLMEASGTALTLVDTPAGIFMPPHQRRIRMAAQQPNLFPHRSALGNLLYALPETRHGEDGAIGLLTDFDLADKGGNLPKQLSGGEAQRLNLARALAAPHSRMLLLDEPFSGMDGSRRERILPYIRDRAAKDFVPVLSVTHDVAEAFQLGAEVIKLAEGRVVEQGPVEVVLAEERARLLTQLNPAGLKETGGSRA